MSTHRIHTSCKLFLITLLLWSATAGAINFNLKNKARPQLSIQVGKGNKNINEVAFSVPASQVGDGSVIAAKPGIKIKVEIRATGAIPLSAFLTVDSFSNPLETNDPGGTSTIPFSQISWTARKGAIPSGTFTGTINQPLVDFTSSQRKLDDFHSFSYANTLDLQAGTYTGRVIYTWAVP